MTGNPCPASCWIIGATPLNIDYSCKLIELPASGISRAVKPLCYRLQRPMASPHIQTHNQSFQMFQNHFQHVGTAAFY
jgi:hypothetical protein